MTLDEVKQKLKVFDKYTFEEDTHTYYCNGVKVGIGVTSLIGFYANKFDEQEVAERVLEKNIKNYNYAKTQLKLYYPSGSNVNTEYLQELYNYLKLPITIQDIIAEWHYKRDFSCEKGTTIHEYTQSLFSGNEWHLRPFDNSEEYLETVERIKHHSLNYYNDYKDRYIHIKDELLIGVEWADVSSAIDHLFYDKVDKGVVIVDYKTNSYMDGYYDNPDKKVYKKYMMIPFQDTLDDSYEHYKIQLSIYKYILQELLGIPVLRTEIVYLTENKDNYEVIQIPYEKEKAELMLEMRRVKDMNGMGVLIMGASGSGKSTSLRNLPAEETAIINITNKPMPFRNKDNKKIVSLKDFKKDGEQDLSYEELYKRIITTIKATKKKIIVIDDSSYMMTFENFEKANNKGYDKFTNMAKNYYDLIKSAISCDDEKIVYVITHEEIDDVNQLYRPKTIGKMLSNQLVIEGLFSIVLRSLYKNGEYIFQTQNDGTSVCKSPMDLFKQKEMPNDLLEIDKLIREYYGFKPIINETEKVEK